MAGCDSTVRVLYIAGYGRSGSTLLDVLLDNSPHVFGAGELSGICREIESGGFCSCGKRYSECTFWSAVVARLEADGMVLAGTGDTSQVKFRAGGDDFCRLWTSIFRAIAEESGAAIVVDSSKSSRRASRRLFRLRRCGLDVRAVHLVRDPRAVMWSIRRGSNRLLEAEKKEASIIGGMARGLIGWLMANLSAEITAFLIRTPIMRVRYEDLVSEPERELQRVGAFAEVDVQTVLQKLSDSQPFSPGHGTSGNRMRRQGPIRLGDDAEWDRRLPAFGRALALLVWPLAQRYGYRVLRRKTRDQFGQGPAAAADNCERPNDTGRRTVKV